MSTRIWESNKGDVTLLGVVNSQPVTDREGNDVVALDPDNAIAQRLFDYGQMSKEQRRGITHLLTVDGQGERHTGLLKSWTLTGRRGERRMDATFINQDKFFESIRLSR